MTMAVKCDPEMCVTSKLINNMETTSDPGYESDEADLIGDTPRVDRVLPRLTGNRIILMMKRCGPSKLVSSISKIILNVSINKMKNFKSCKRVE